MKFTGYPTSASIVGLACASLAGLATGMWARPSTILVAAVQNPTCPIYWNPNYQAFNRCTWAHINGEGEVLTCTNQPIPGRIPVTINLLNLKITKVSCRFTLSPTLPQDRTVSGVWIYFEKKGNPDPYLISLNADINGRPGVSLGQSTFVASPLGGNTGWQFISFATPLPTLQPGSIYHVVVQPGGGSTYSQGDCIVMISARSKCPVPYSPSDETNSAVKSPFDAWLAVMKSQATVGMDEFFVEGAGVQAFSPIFALDLGTSGLVGQPFNTHLEPDIFGVHEYGQAMLMSSTMTINYVAFFARGSGCPPPPNEPSHPHPQGALRVDVYSSADLTNSLGYAVLHRGQNAPNGGGHVYLTRSHWFGGRLSNSVTLSSPGTYYFVLSSPASVGDEEWDRWTLAVEGSTLPPPASSIPTYMRGRSHAIESHDGGATFTPMGGKKFDIGFVLGNFPGGLSTPLAILDDASPEITSPCAGAYPTTAPGGSQIRFGGTERNIGAADSDYPNGLYYRLLDFSCTEVSPAVPQCRDCDTSNSIPCPADHCPVGPNDEGNSEVIYTMADTPGSDDAFLLLECGHFEGSSMVADDILPYEVREGPCPN